MTDADKKLYDKAVEDLWSIASGTPEEIDAMTTPWIAGYKAGYKDALSGYDPFKEYFEKDGEEEIIDEDFSV